jgi:hypothetical protein
MADQPINVVPLESEELRQLKDAAKLLADMPEVERTYWLPKRAEQIGVTERALRLAVRAEQMERANRITKERLERDRLAKQKAEAAAKEQREDDRRRKEEKRELDAQKKAQEKHERDANKAAEREKRLAKQKAERNSAKPNGKRRRRPPPRLRRSPPS